MSSDALTLSEQSALLEDWVAAATTSAKIHLFINDITPSPGTTFADLVEPTASWYTPATATYGDVFQNPDGSVEVRCTSAQFNYSGTDAACTVYGWAVCTPSVFTLLHASNLPGGPTMMGAVGDAVIAYPGFRVSSIPQVLPS